MITGRVAGHGGAAANVSTATPLGRISQLSPNAASTLRWASSDTAVRTASLETIARRGTLNASYHAFRPGCAAWKVPTAGMSVPTRAAWLAPGDSGSCRCRTSGANTRSASSVRAAIALLDAIGAIEPFEGNRIVEPIDVIPGSGGGPSDGSDDARVHAALAEFGGEPEHLRLDAAEHRQRVRAEQRDAQRPHVGLPIGSRPHRLEPLTA